MNKNVIWTKNHKIKSLNIFPDDREGDYVNMIGQIKYVKYYENIIDPSNHIEITIADVNGLVDSLPIRSGSSIELKCEHPSQDGEFVYKGVISNIVGKTMDARKEVYTLICETGGTFSNHTTRVWERFDGNISKTVKSILKDKVKVDKDVNVDSTSTESSFYGNYRRPFKVIADLAPKAIPDNVGVSTGGNSGSAGYLFYETIDSYNFKSIDKLFDIKNNKSLPPKDETYTLTPYKDALDVRNNFKIVNSPAFKESHDLIKKLRSGAYSTANWYYDSITRKVHFYNFKYNPAIKKSNAEELTPTGYAKPYSRIILGTIDQGTTSSNPEGTDLPTPQNQAKNQAQASARYSALFSQMVDFTIPMNLSLRVGQVIRVQFPHLNIDKDTDLQSTESGFYLIARLSHEFGNTSGDYTGVSLVRDSFTINE
tara:strand:+ start:282 stop:1559 length:1278 start_codon:yes stop_codon:yes gene_type:complete